MINWVRQCLRIAPDRDFFDLLHWLGLVTVIVGYLLALVTGRPLIPGPFLAFTAINVAWVALLFWLQRPGVRRVVVTLQLSAMTLLAIAALFCLPLGVGFDWILATVTIAIVALASGWRPALVVIATSALASAGALLLAGSNWSATVSSLSQLLTAYLFAMIFAAVIRRQQELREQAEALAAAVSRANSELERAHNELRVRASQAEELSVSRERNRMAREIHDTLGHYLTILAVQLETALKLEERGDSQLEATLRDARRVAGECLAEVRRSVAALRPGDVAAFSLTEALRRLVDETQTLTPSMEITLDAEEPEAEAGPELRAALYRCAQEALTNVRKHAAASKALVRLRMEPGAAHGHTGADEVELTVLDNGRGAEGSEASEPGFGLLGMRERVALLGGAAQAGPEPGRGWRVVIRAPLTALDSERRAPEIARAGAAGASDA
ncbi:MAG TPA: sensor histidine kinase [Ktedonobacterales bacterium]